MKRKNGCGNTVERITIYKSECDVTGFDLASNRDEHTNRGEWINSKRKIGYINELMKNSQLFNGRKLWKCKQLVEKLRHDFICYLYINIWEILNLVKFLSMLEKLVIKKWQKEIMRKKLFRIFFLSIFWHKFTCYSRH